MWSWHWSRELASGTCPRDGFCLHCLSLGLFSLINREKPLTGPRQTGLCSSRNHGIWTHASVDCMPLSVWELLSEVSIDRAGFQLRLNYVVCAMQTRTQCGTTTTSNNIQCIDNQFSTNYEGIRKAYYE